MSDWEILAFLLLAFVALELAIHAYEWRRLVAVTERTQNHCDKLIAALDKLADSA